MSQSLPRFLRARVRRPAAAVIVLFSVLSPAAADPPAAGLADLPAVRPAEVGAGSLLLRGQDEATPDYRLGPTVGTDVSIDVGGMVARATVRQQFFNPARDWVEGLYVFPLPENAAVDHLRLRVGERVIEGVIKERQEARRIYETARAEGRKAGLLESERPNIFTTSIANIGPGEQVTVEIEYQQTLRYDQGAFSLRFPMVVGPRYVPGAMQTVSFGPGGWGVESTEQVPDAGRITSPVLPPEAGKTNPVRLQVTLTPGFPIAAIESPHHQVTIAEADDGRRIVTLADEVVPADRDFELVWRPAANAAPVAALLAESRDDGQYLLAMVLPPSPAGSGDVLPAPPREVVFVLDVSGSMGGASIRQAKAALDLALSRLRPADSFNVIVFNHATRSLFRDARPAMRDAVARARRFVDGLDAEGGTEMAPALMQALTGAPPAGKLRQVVFLTDGAVGNETELFDIIDRNLGASRLFTVGIGSAPNSYFMAKAAETGRGTFTHIGEVAQVAKRMEALFAKLEHPVMTDLAAAWPAGLMPEMSRSTLPDLYAGEPVVFTARLDKLAGAVTISGERAGAPWSARLELSKAAPAQGIAALWAHDRIDSLMHQSGVFMEPAEVRSEVVALGLAHHMVTRFTSLVAVDVTPSRPEGEDLATRKLPHNLPHGWDYEKVFGERPQPAPQPMRDASAGRAKTVLAADAVVVGADAALSLPQGATPSRLHLLIGVALLLVGLAALGRLRNA